MKISNPFIKIQNKFIFNPFKEGGRNPYLDWSMILVVSFILMIILVINGINLYTRVSGGYINIENTNLATSTEIFDVKVLDSVINKFNSKKVQTLNIQRNFQFISDPSI